MGESPLVRESAKLLSHETTRMLSWLSPDTSCPECEWSSPSQLAQLMAPRGHVPSATGVIPGPTLPAAPVGRLSLSGPVAVHILTNEFHLGFVSEPLIITCLPFRHPLVDFMLSPTPRSTARAFPECHSSPVLHISSQTYRYRQFWVSHFSQHSESW